MELVEAEGQQVEQEESLREIVLPVAKVVLEMVAVVLQRVEAFILDRVRPDRDGDGQPPGP